VPPIDWRAVRSGALPGLLIIIPAALLASVSVGDRGRPIWSVVFGVLVLFGFMTAGYGAGRLRTDTPMMHGALAAVACYVVVQAFGIVTSLARGNSLSPDKYILTVLLAAVMGVAGGLFADWYRRRLSRA